MWTKNCKDIGFFAQAMGICACSAGNHAQGVAFSAAALDISVRLG